MIRANIFWAFIIVFTVLLEATWLGLLRIQGVQPELILMLVVYFAITEGEERAMMTGFLGGLFQDVASDSALGHHVLCLVVVGFVMGRLSRRLITDNPAVKAGSVLGASVTHGLLYMTIDYVQNADPGRFYVLLVMIAPQAFYTALMTPFLFFALARGPMPQARRVT